MGCTGGAALMSLLWPLPWTVIMQDGGWPGRVLGMAGPVFRLLGLAVFKARLPASILYVSLI